jgi:hypothetical protein
MQVYYSYFRLFLIVVWICKSFLIILYHYVSILVINQSSLLMIFPTASLSGDSGLSIRGTVLTSCGGQETVAMASLAALMVALVRRCGA